MRLQWDRAQQARAAPTGNSWAKFRGAVAALVVLSTGCGVDGRSGAEDWTRPLLVMAASSLRPVVPDLVAAFEHDTGASVLVVYGSSSSLAAQIESGAPADLFLSADEVSVDRLLASGRIRSRTRLPYGTGRLVAIWGGASRPLSSLDELLEPSYGVIAIANPRTAPYGSAALSALETTGVLETLEGRLVHAENVADAYQMVRTGNADVALVAATLAAEIGEERTLAIDRSLYPPLIHVAGIPAASDHPLADDLLDFIRSEVAQSILLAGGGLNPIQD